MLNPILTATKITNKEVIKANIFDESSFKFIKTTTPLFGIRF